MIAVLSASFFLSGACGLIYEIVWMRHLGLIFGNTTLAISTVLATFMAGLGFGSYFFGRMIDTRSDPLRYYAFLNFGVGSFCMATPAMWGWVESVYVYLHQTLQPNFWQFSAIRFALCFMVMFVPTFLMGGTLPILIKFLIRDCGQTAKTVGRLTGLNTLGACVGVLTASFFAIYRLGLANTVILTACLNLAIGAAALMIRKALGESAPAMEKSRAAKVAETRRAPRADGVLRERWMIRILLVVLALSGFTAMAYEICWTKVLALCIGSSVYSFAIMLATFLVGLSLGALLVSMLASRIRISYSLVGFVQIAVAGWVLWGMSMFDRMPLYFLSLFARLGDNPAWVQIARFLLVGIVILPPTIFIGCMFAMVTHMLNKSLQSTGRTIGGADLIETCGFICGAIVSGFILIPAIGIYWTMIVMVLVNCVAGGALLALSRKTWSRQQAIFGGAAALLLLLLFAQAQPWSRGLLTTNIAVNPEPYFGHTKHEIISSVSQAELLFYREGLGGTVAVKRHHESVSLTLNANLEGSNAGDMYTQLMSGHLPSLLAPRRDSVLVIGMGTAVTLGALATHDYERIDCVEIEGAVLEAADFFAKESRNVLDDPRLNAIVNDGRNHLLVEDHEYDVIISVPSIPWMAGVTNLFSIEHFKLMRKRLAPDGIACQWMNIYSLTPENIRMIVNTFQRVFPETSLWHTDGGDLLLLGSLTPLAYDLDEINRRFDENDLLREDLRDFMVQDSAGLLSCFLLTHSELLQLRRGALLNTDNLPHLERTARINLYGADKVTSANVEMINRHRRSLYPDLINPPSKPQERARFHNAVARASLSQGNRAYAHKEMSLSNEAVESNDGLKLLVGIEKLSRGDALEAIEFLSAYLESQPESADANFHLAKACVMIGRSQMALPHFAAALREWPDNTEYLQHYVEALRDAGELQRALDVLDDLIDVRGMSFPNGLLRAKILGAMERVDAAISTLERLIDKYPHTVNGYIALAGIYQHFRDWPRAISVYERARLRIPHDDRIYSALAELYRLNGNPRAARAMSRRYERHKRSPRIGG